MTCFEKREQVLYEDEGMCVTVVRDNPNFMSGRDKMLRFLDFMDDCRARGNVSSTPISDFRRKILGIVG